MVNYQDPNSYKRCQKKQYDIYVCKPHTNTVVINKLEQADVVKQLGREYFTAEEIENIHQTNPQMFSTLRDFIETGRAYVVDQNTPYVLAGTLGEMWCINTQKLTKRYTFSTGESINPSSLSKRGKDGIMSWQSIKTVPDNSKAWACFVPNEQKGQVQTLFKAVLNINGVGVSHGKGDFIIAQDAGGQPNLGDIYVVNGNVFATTYNNQGWTDCLDQRFLNAKSSNITIDKLPKLVNISENNTEGIDKKSISDFKKELRNYLDKICKVKSLEVQEEGQGLVSIIIQTVYAKELLQFKVVYAMHEQEPKFYELSVDNRVVNKVLSISIMNTVFNLNEKFDLTSTVAKHIANGVQIALKRINCEKAYSLFMSLWTTFYIDDFDTSKDRREDPNTDLLRDKGRFSFKERDLKSEKSTTVFVGALDDGSIGVRATRDGKKFQHKYFLNLDKDVKWHETIIGVLAYLELCKDLNLTPYRFITSQRYIQYILKNTEALDIAYKIKTSVSLVPNSFVREKKSDNTRHLSKCNFKVNYRGEDIDSSLDAEVRLKINKSLLDEIISEIKENIKNKGDEFYEYGGTCKMAFILEAKVAYQSFESESSPNKFEKFLIGIFEDGLREEQRRQHKSNREQSLKRRLGDIFVDNDESRMKLFKFMEEEGKGTVQIYHNKRVQFRHKAPWATVVYYVEKVDDVIAITYFVTNDSPNESFDIGTQSTTLNGDSTLYDIYNAIEKDYQPGGKYWSAR